MEWRCHKTHSSWAKINWISASWDDSTISNKSYFSDFGGSCSHGFLDAMVEAHLSALLLFSWPFCVYCSYHTNRLNDVWFVHLWAGIDDGLVVGPYKTPLGHADMVQSVYLVDTMVAMDIHRRIQCPLFNKRHILSRLDTPLRSTLKVGRSGICKAPS